MVRRTNFLLYQPKTILNKGKRADHWFWTRYSAYPYIGCQHGCIFCYCRERKYAPYADPNDFAYLIKIKTNAPLLLRRALGRVPVDLLFTGDYQPAERKFRLSRQMLEVCLELGFPVFVLSRSPLVLRDLDLLKAINERARAVVAFSIISTPESPGYERVSRIERLAPLSEKRFAAMEQFARAGILTGTCMMPILPVLCDQDINLENVVRWTAAHGGKFVLPSSLTLSDQQRAFFFDFLSGSYPDMLESYQRFYPEGSYGPVNYSMRAVDLRVLELCRQAGISDRIPRPVIAGEKRAINKRIVEALAYQLHIHELNNANQQLIWAYRKAAWAIEDLEQDIVLVYRTFGSKGLENIPNIDQRLAREIELLLANLPSHDINGSLIPALAHGHQDYHQ